MASEMASEMAPRHTDAADAALRPALYSALRPAHAPGDIISDLLRRWREACSGGCRASRLCSVQSLLSALLSRYGYTSVVAFATAMLTYPFGFFRSSPQDVTNELFQP